MSALFELLVLTNTWVHVPSGNTYFFRGNETSDQDADVLIMKEDNGQTFLLGTFKYRIDSDTLYIHDTPYVLVSVDRSSNPPSMILRPPTGGDVHFEGRPLS